MIYLQGSINTESFAEKASTFAQSLEVLLLSYVYVYHMTFRVNNVGLSWFCSIPWGQCTGVPLYLLKALYLHVARLCCFVA